MSERRVFWSAVDLAATEFPEPRWAVPGLLPEGVTLLAGAPKLGKSWLSLDVACAIAYGGLALGSIPVERGPVIVLALEDTARRLQSRLKVITRGPPAPADLMFALEWRRFGEGGEHDLDVALERRPDCRLVVVDVLARIRPATSNRDSLYASDYEAVARLKEIADRHGVAVIAVHHVRKSPSEDFLERVSGSNGLAGAADSVAVLARSRSAADAVLHLVGRDVEDAEHALKFDAGLWQILDGPAHDYALSDTRRRIVQFLRDVGSATPKQVAEALDIEHNTAKQRLWRMAKDSDIVTDGQGNYQPLPTPVTPITHNPDSYPGYEGYWDMSGDGDL